jgi:hypothetical protein
MSSKIKIFILVIVLFLIVVSSLFGAYLFFAKTSQPKFADSTNDNVDSAVYKEIQSLMLRTPLAKPEVIKDSLKLYDIDGDGKKDVLGFMKLTFGPNDSTYLFSTWYNKGQSYEYYEDGYNGFRVDPETSCSITGLAIEKVTLSCIESSQKYSLTLVYQKNGEGYYRDVSEDLITFNNNQNWPVYISKNGGIQFYHPQNITIAEKTYDIYNKLITVIIGTQNNERIFEVHSQPAEGDMGGGVIDSAWRGVFLKLDDDTYLSRSFTPVDAYNKEKGIFYQKTHVYEKNNVGSFFNSFDSTNVEQGRGYILFTTKTSEADLKEVDSIFSSIKYMQASAISSTEIIPIQNNSFLFSNVAKITVPGVMSDAPVAQGDKSNPITSKAFNIMFIDSPVYQPPSLQMKLYSYGSIGDVNALGGGGYNIEKGCFNFEKDVFKTPQIMGANQVCPYGWGDAGFLMQGYYIIDPNKKYILAIAEEGDYTGLYPILSPDLKSIVESVQFSY